MNIMYFRLVLRDIYSFILPKLKYSRWFFLIASADQKISLV